MAAISMKTVGFDALVKTLEDVSENITKELKAVSSKVGTKGKSVFSKEVSRNIAVKQSDVKRHVTVKKLGWGGVEITLEKTNRIPLKRFKPRQTKAGISYKIDKNGPRKVIPGGFMGPNPTVSTVKFYGHPFIRKGKSRLPIAKIAGGPSAAGAIDNHPSRIKSIKRQLSREVRKQLVRRIKYRRLKIAGTI